MSHDKLSLSGESVCRHGFRESAEAVCLNCQCERVSDAASRRVPGAFFDPGEVYSVLREKGSTGSVVGDRAILEEARICGISDVPETTPMVAAFGVPDRLRGSRLRPPLKGEPHDGDPYP